MSDSKSGAGGVGDRMIRADMTTQEATTEPFPEAWRFLGGRALSARILIDECDANCDPLGPDNLLILAPGVLAGTAAPTSGRISVGGKSPLTGGIKEANAGGNPGQHLTKLGYRVIVVKGQPADADARFGLEVDAEGVREHRMSRHHTTGTPSGLGLRIISAPEAFFQLLAELVS